MAAESNILLSVRDLRTEFTTDQGTARAVDGVSFDLPAGKTLALVGESGCGKSVTAMSLMRLIPSPPGRVAGGEALFDGKDLLALPEREMRRIRGNDISMIFQEPMTSMNPVFRVGAQIAAVLRMHRRLDKAAAWRGAVEMMGRVGIPSAARRAEDYPHQMSGGMLQRVMIAMALSCGPRLLIADEPTTALDVTIQAQILELLRELQRNTGMTLLLITHDLGVVAETADEVAVMYAGRIVERAAADRLFKSPAHPYTRALFQSLPPMNRGAARLSTIRGSVPPATHFPSGCRFHPRCAEAMPVCALREPPFAGTAPGHAAACWLHHPNPPGGETVVPEKPEERA
ncbi:MAG: ABC transporter ATP-binding protein [Candidatus Hydrogenedens sp.]|nr:ABC transporter ATP-binding protein [Candidatus Hydrogenedentota bacterium]NLF58573.1 ABC transporter ATP-binding protein [Candidatus Hydrogenedens sp.]